MSQNKNTILHLAVDFPNFYRKENTVAVKNFIKSNDTYNHKVVALTRTANPFKVAQIFKDNKNEITRDVISVMYWGLPFGLFLNISMWIVSKRVIAILKKYEWNPVLIHAHKLTFEGIAANFISRKINIPFVLSVRGEAESKILRYKPHYKDLIQSIIDNSKALFYVSAWIKPTLNEKFNIPEEKQFYLPNFVDESLINNKPLSSFTNNSFVTILDLNVYKKKGLHNLIIAFKRLSIKFPELKLDVIGRGEHNVVNEVKGLIQRCELIGIVNLLGPIPHNKLLSMLPEYKALVLPSQNETFGMVYVEALLCNLPILYSKGTGIDGFLDDFEVGVGVNCVDTNEIFLGLEELYMNYTRYKSWLVSNRELITQRFSTQVYLKQFNEIVKKEI